jgi:hypothetical protein
MAHPYRHANQNDAARTEAIDPPAQQWGDDTQSDGGDGEATRDGLTAPAEFRGQRLHKNGEGIDE